MEKLITTKEAARRLKVCTGTVYRYRAYGLEPVEGPDASRRNRYMYRASDVAAFVKPRLGAPRKT